MTRRDSDTPPTEIMRDVHPEEDDPTDSEGQLVLHDPAATPVPMEDGSSEDEPSVPIPRRGMTEPAAVRLAGDIRALAKLQLEGAALASRALTAQAARDQAWAEFWSVLRIVPWAFVKDGWIRVIVAGGLVLGLLSLVGVEVSDVDTLVHTAVYALYCGDGGVRAATPRKTEEPQAPEEDLEPQQPHP